MTGQLPRLRPILLIAYCIALSGCSNNEQAPTIVAEQELVSAALDAADEWCEATDHEWCPTVTTTGRGYPLRAVPHGLQIRGKDACGCFTKRGIEVPLVDVESGVCGFTSAAAPDELIPADVVLRRIIAHEIGHINDLPDSMDDTSVMFWDSYGVDHVTRTDGQKMLAALK